VVADNVFGDFVSNRQQELLGTVCVYMCVCVYVYRCVCLCVVVFYKKQPGVFVLVVRVFLVSLIFF